MWISSQGNTSASGQDIHHTADAALGVFGERRRHTQLPQPYTLQDDVQLHEFDVSSSTDVPPRRRRHATLQSRRTDVEVAPRRSCSAVPDPPVWHDYGGHERQPGTSSHPSYDPSQFPFTQPWQHLFHTVSGSYTSPSYGGTNIPSSSTSFSPMMGFVSYNTPRAQTFSSFGFHSEETGLNVQQQNIPSRTNAGQEGAILGGDEQDPQQEQSIPRRRNPQRQRR